MTHAMTKVAVVVLTLLAAGARAQEGGEVGAGRVGLRAFTGYNRAVGNVGSVGLKYFLSDDVALNLDVGVALVAPSGGSPAFGFGVAPGVDFYLGQGPLRPFITGGLGFGRAAMPDAGLDLALELGGGAEYFFNRNVSVAIRALLPFTFQDLGGDFAFSITTATPSAGLTLYF